MLDHLGLLFQSCSHLDHAATYENDIVTLHDILTQLHQAPLHSCAVQAWVRYLGLLRTDAIYAPGNVYNL